MLTSLGLTIQGKEMRKLIFFAIACSLLIGCSSTLKTQPLVDKNQSTIYKGGIEFITSKKDHSEVMMGLQNNTYLSGQRLTFAVAVQNHLNQPIIFSTDNISATVEGMPLKVFSYDELILEVEEKRRDAVVSAILNGTAESINAIQAGYQYNSDGTYSGVYNSSVVEQAQMRAMADEEMKKNMANTTAYLESSNLNNTILKKETVLPNDSHRGHIQLEETPTPKISNIIEFKVTFGEDEHLFKFEQTNLDNASQVRY